MFARRSEIPPTRLSMIARCVSSIALVLLIAATVSQARAQGSFNSGSTGADGAFNPPNNFVLQIPESGVLNYTTITINSDLYFRANSRNTPVTLLATGNVIISGRLFLSGGSGSSNNLGGFGGPGGSRGGDAGSGFENFNGTAGDGPGSGTGGRGTADHASPGAGGGGGFAGSGGSGGGQNPGQGGSGYGTRTLLPLMGGSGGGGGSGFTGNGVGGGGGGGGGAILIASSGNITFGAGSDNYGEIYAQGGYANEVANNCCPSAGGGGGSGGAIRLVANRISGAAGLGVGGGSGSRGGGNGAQGYVRVEAYDLTAFTPSASSSLTLGQPNPAMLPNMPQLRIASIGGIAAPALPNGSFHALPDIVVPTSQPNPVTAAIEASNIPLGTVVQLTLTPDSGARTTVNSTPLAGSQAASNATASVTLPTTGIAVITATTTFDVVAALGRPLFIDGQRVDRIEVAATFGGSSVLTYITHAGKRIKM